MPNRKKLSSNVFKGMFTLAKGAIIARIIGMASIPLLTRIYSPEDFGVLAMYMALVAIIAPTLTLRYVQAIPLPKTDVIAINLFSVCLKLIFWGTLIVALVLSLFAEEILVQFDMQSLAVYWPIIVVGVWGCSLYELFSLWATRKKQYKVLSSTQVTQSLMGNSAKILLGLLLVKPAGLLVGQFLAQSGGVASFVKHSWKDFRRLKIKINSKKERFVAQYYRGFPYYRLPSQFLMLLSMQAPVLMMAYLYDKNMTGQLSLAMTALSLPAGLIGAAVAKAYYAEIAALGKNNIAQIRKITIDVQKKLLFIGLPMMLVVILLAEPMFMVVFGGEWVMAGKFAAIMSPFILLQFTSAPLMQVINVVGSQLVFLFINLVRAVGLMVIFVLFELGAYEEIMLVKTLSVFLVVFYFVITSYIFHAVGDRVESKYA